jgi:hypothetical protein
MLLQKLRRWLWRSPRSPRLARRRLLRLELLRLELLEDRTVPSTVNWINPAGGDWSTASNWDAAHVPGPDDDAVINLAGPITVTHSQGTDSIHSLTTAANNNLVLTGSTLRLADTSTVNGVLTMTNGAFGGGGTIDGPGDLNIDGGLTWISGYMTGSGHTHLNSNATLSGNTDTFFNPRGLYGRTLDNAATATWTDAGWLIIRSGGVWNNLAGSTFLAQGDATLDSGSVFVSPGRFNNAGTLRKAGSSGTTTIGIAVNNTGLVDVVNGTLSLGGSGNSSGNAVSPGSYAVAAGATLGFSGNTNLRAASSISGAGNVAFTAGTTDVLGTYSITGNTLVAGGTVNFDTNVELPTLTISSGALSGDGTVTVDSLLTWTGGLMSGLGTTLANGGIAISGSASFGLSGGRTLDNAGTATWNGSGNFGLADGSVFDNLQGALFDIRGSGNIADGFFFGPSSYFVNEGTLLKEIGAGTTSDSTFFTNTGTLDVESGTFTLTAVPLYNQGAVVVGSGATLGVSNGLFNLQGATVSGTGAISANVTNYGQVNPGGDGTAGILTITGSFTQTADGILSIDVGGYNAGTDFDQLNVSGALTLDGTLTINLIGGFVPSTGNAFQVLNFNSVSGSFATVNQPAGAVFALVIEAHDLQLVTQ